jgi:iron complex transport system substrate-binding protein
VSPSTRHPDRRPVRRLVRLLASSLAAACLLAACADDGDPPTSHEGADTSEAVGTDSGEAGADDPGSDNPVGAGDDVRTVTTVAGEVELPADVDRVVSTHNIATQPLVDLGVEPVGIGDLPEEAAYPEYWEAIGDLPQVGNGIEIDVEEVASLDPDVIFAINLATPETLDQLEAVAPVIVIGIEGPQRADWEGRAELVAEVTESEDALDGLEQRYADEVEAISTVNADTLAAETFVILDAFETGAVVPYGPDSMVGSVLGPTGIRFAPSATSELVQGVEESPDVSVSFEQLPELTDGSVVLHGALASTSEPTGPVQDLLDSPLFRASEAAETGQVYPIGKTVIAGYGDAFAALEQFEDALTQVAGD